MTKCVLAIDQGTTSSRAIIFNHDGDIVTVAQKEHQQIFPNAGLVEHDPIEIRDNVIDVVTAAIHQAEIMPTDLCAVGITNQRETTIVWDKNTGEPIYNALVWQDTRTDTLIRELAGNTGNTGNATRNKYRDVCGLPLATYFSGPKIRWLLDHVPGARTKAEAGDLLCGTIDSWILWNLTGGPHGGIHATDVTNASRTMLMNIRTLTWDAGICAEMRIPMAMLPTIRSSSEIYGMAAHDTPIAGVPIAGILGDQQAAMFGQACFTPATAKNTYGTGCFALMNTGNDVVFSDNGLLTTVAYQLGDAKPVYAVEGSIAVAGSLVQWLRDNLGLISNAAEIEALANTVPNNGGVYFVPAFSGLFAPYWRDDARGALVGLTRFNNKGHIARATLEATAFQTADVMAAMNTDAGRELTELRVDGGMTANHTLMQFQADILGVDVVVPAVTETTALGAAYAAGIAVEFWNGQDDVTARWQVAQRFSPKMGAETRERYLRLWRKAVTRTFNWVDEDAEHIDD